MSAQTPEYLSADYWDERYKNHQTGWDLGAISSPLKAYFDQLAEKNIKILIPGAGNSYEAIYLAENGFTNITVVDISQLVTTSLSEAIQVRGYQDVITIIHGDFFSLEGNYDLIVEQTFFCALDPLNREAYIRKMAALLAGNGKLVGLLFNRDFPDNPPFGGNQEAYRQLFSVHMRILKMTPCYNSIPARNGTELFLIAEKKT